MKKKPNIIYLRGHHLLCLQGYQGYGYDEKFKKSMDKVFCQLNINNNKDNNIKNNNEDKNDENKENQRFSNSSKINNENTVILTDYPDDLCGHCPNLIDDKCAGEIIDLKSTAQNTDKINLNNEKIIKMDQLVLQRAKLKKDTEYSIDKAISSVNKTFYSINKAKEVCGNCEWENKCLWFQTRNSLNSQ